FFFSSRRRHTRCYRDWSSDVCSSDLLDAEEDLHAVVGHVEAPDHQELPLTPAPGQQRLRPGSRRRAGPLDVGVHELSRRGEQERSEERRVGKEGRWWWGTDP